MTLRAWGPRVPEGDTVWLAAARMHERFAGKPLVSTDFRVPRLATADLSGRTVLEVVPRGKHMMTRFAAAGREPATTLHTHFKMDGTWRLHSPGAPWTGAPDWQVRVVLTNADTVAVGYRMPVVELLATADEQRVVGHLGPDTLGPDWDLDLAVANLLAQPDREIGPALLDQRNLAGIGNLYKSEVLFLRGTTPWAQVGDVVDLPTLVRLSQRLLLANRDRWEQTTTGDTRPGADHWVFERQHKPCRRCGTRVASAEQGEGGRQVRIVYWCPVCQQGPAPPRSAWGVSTPRPQGRTRYRS